MRALACTSSPAGCASAATSTSPKASGALPAILLISTAFPIAAASRSARTPIYCCSMRRRSVSHPQSAWPICQAAAGAPSAGRPVCMACSATASRRSTARTTSSTPRGRAMCSTASTQAKALISRQWRRSENRDLLALSWRRGDAFVYAGAERALCHDPRHSLWLWRRDDRHVRLPARTGGAAHRLRRRCQRLHVGGAGGFRTAEICRRRLSNLARYPSLARARGRSRTNRGVAARNGQLLVTVSRRLSGRHQQSQAARVRRGVLSAIHRARCALGAAVPALGGDIRRSRGLHLFHAGAECARAGALSRASPLATSDQQGERCGFRRLRLRPASLSAMTLSASLAAV